MMEMLNQSCHHCKLKKNKILFFANRFNIYKNLSKPVDPSQIGVLNLLDPYLTTYNKEHKKITK